jgi:5-methylcytosine-specific restriction endonuclease McrA
MRSVDEWIGKDDDTAVPPHVRLRVWDREEGKCHKCGRRIQGFREKWTLEHRIAICNGGGNRESNLCCTCEFCLPEKNADDAAEKSSVYHKRAKHLGIETKKKRWRWG